MVYPNNSNTYTTNYLIKLVIREPDLKLKIRQERKYSTVHEQFSSSFVRMRRFCHKKFLGKSWYSWTSILMFFERLFF